MTPKVNLYDPNNLDYLDSQRYQALVGKLLYLIVTRPNISLAIGRVNQFMDKPKKVHQNPVNHILPYLKSTLGNGLCFKSHEHLNIFGFSDDDYARSNEDRCLITGYCTYVGSNLVVWRSKKEHVSWSSVEFECRAIAHTACELLWISSLLPDIGISVQHSIPMYCNNKATTFNANNPTFHERTKHIQVDCHFIRDVVMHSQICLQSLKQLADIFTQALPKAHIMKNLFRLGKRDVYAPARREVSSEHLFYISLTL